MSAELNAEWKKMFVAEPPAPRDGPLPSVALCIVTATPSLVKTAVELARAHATGVVHVYIWANACKVDDIVGAWVHEVPTNEGVVEPMHKLYLEAAKDGHDIIVWTHDDVEIYEDGWDERVAARFKASPDCMLVGFGGAATLGREDMWTCGSAWEPQRGPFASNLTAPRTGLTVAEVHGPRIDYDCKAATIDGFVCAVRRTFLDQIGGLSWWKIVHHGYDAALACQVRRAGKETWIVPIAMGHPWIGATSQRADGLQMMAKSGGNYSLFLRAIEMIREQFPDVVPFGLPGCKHVTVDLNAAQMIYDTYFGSITVPAVEPSPLADAYLDLLKRALVVVVHANIDAMGAYQRCAVDVLARDVPGDLVDATTMDTLTRGVLKAYGVVGRQVWVDLTKYFGKVLGLEDGQIEALSLQTADLARISLIHVDASTWHWLPLLYPRLSKNGFVVIEDYASCKEHVDAFRKVHGLQEVMFEDAGVTFWRREKTWWVPAPAAKRVTLVVPTLSREGAIRTSGLVMAAMQGTRAPDHLFVIDNGGHFGPSTTAIEVHRPKTNLGVAPSWNEALRRFGDYVIIASDDVTITPTTIETFVNMAELSDKVLFVCDVGQGFPFFLIKQAAVRLVGLFDEQFTPAYFEDTDYLHRLALVGQKPVVIEGQVQHPAPDDAATTAREMQWKADLIVGQNRQRYIAKWGGPPGQEKKSQVTIGLPRQLPPGGPMPQTDGSGNWVNPGALGRRHKG